MLPGLSSFNSHKGKECDRTVGDVKEQFVDAKIWKELKIRVVTKKPEIELNYHYKAIIFHF